MKSISTSSFPGFDCDNISKSVTGRPVQEGTRETKAYRNNRPKAHEKRRYYRHYVALTGSAHSGSKVPSVVLL